MSWNRSILAPYLLTISCGSFLINHDVRMRYSQVGMLTSHKSEVIAASWSTNGSHEQMRQSDPSNVMLASSARGAELAVWRITDMLYGQFDRMGLGKQEHAEPLFYDDQSFLSPIKAMAWSPNHECVLATGGGEGDQIIRMYDFKKSNEIQHTIRCNSPITQIAWRKTKLRATHQQRIEDVSLQFCEELLTTHGGDCEMKLWQMNKYHGAPT